MRRGSLSERFMRCGKAECACATDPDARHGPYYSLTRGAGGRTTSRLVSAEQAKLVRAQVDAGHQFRKQVEAFWGACEQWADAQLDIAQAASQPEAAKKGGSKKPSTRKSSTK
jgi:hypothetical protein